MKIIKNKLDMIVQKSFRREPFYASDTAEKNAVKNAKECLKRPITMESMPVKVRLELTNSCNLNCVFCYRPHFKTMDKSVLTLQDIKILSPLLKTAKFITLAQKCESLISPNIIDILDAVGKYKAVISLYTNGQLLDKKISEALIRNKVTFLTISCSAFNDDYQKFHRGGKFRKLVDNISALNELKRKYNSNTPRLRLSFVLRKDTIDYLDDALEFVKKYYFREGIQILLFFRVAEEDKHLELIFNWERYKPIVDSFIAKAEKENILTDFSIDVPKNMRPSLPEQYTKVCYEAWDAFNITPGGNVTPCAQAGAIMGNIRLQKPVMLWNNDNYREFRIRMNKRPYNRDCIDCWYCRYISPFVQGDKLVRLNKIFDSFYRIKPGGIKIEKAD